MANANGSGGGYVVAFSSITPDHNVPQHNSANQGRVLQPGNIALHNNQYQSSAGQQQFYPGSYQTYHGSRSGQVQNNGYGAQQQSYNQLDLNHNKQFQPGYHSQPVLEQGFSTLPNRGAYKGVYPHNPTSVIQPSTHHQAAAAIQGPTGQTQQTFANPPTPNVTPPRQLSPGAVIHATASKSSKGVTLYRSTIPVAATDETSAEVLEPPEATISQVAMDPTPPVPAEVKKIDKEPVILEEDVSYDNVEVTIADVHTEQPVQANAIDDVKSDVSQHSAPVPPAEPAPSQISTTSGIAEATVEVKENLDSPEFTEDTKIFTLNAMDESEEPQVTESELSAKSEQGDEEVYSVVNKPVRESAIVSTEATVEEDPYVAAPPVPTKTADAYLRVKDEEDVHSMSSQGSALEQVREKARKRREELDYYSTVEVNPDSPNKLSVVGGGGSNMIFTEDDDYATVNIPEGPPVPSPTNKDGPTKEEVPAMIPAQVKPAPIDFNLPKGYSFGGIYNVFLHQSDITKLRVNTIVNAANEKLKHKGGIAEQISKAAGKEFDKLCKKKIKQHGDLQVSHVAMTSGGKLPSGRVIHAVGPRWDRYRDKKEATRLLEQTFSNVFKMCADQRVPSVAVPPVSSGLFHVPHGTVTDCLHRSLLSIPTIVSAGGRSDPPPSEIHVVDTTPDILYGLIERLAGPNMTPEGQRFSIEELPAETVAKVVAAVVVQDQPKVDHRSKKKKLQKTPSVAKSKGSTSTFSGAAEQVQNGIHENTHL